MTINEFNEYLNTAINYKKLSQMYTGDIGDQHISIGIVNGKTHLAEIRSVNFGLGWDACELIIQPKKDLYLKEELDKVYPPLGLNVNDGNRVFSCRKCGEIFISYGNYCQHCGTKLKCGE